jgi:hypothetical protein
MVLKLDVVLTRHRRLRFNKALCCFQSQVRPKNCSSFQKYFFLEKIVETKKFGKMRPLVGSLLSGLRASVAGQAGPAASAIAGHHPGRLIQLARAYSATAYTTRYADYDTLLVTAPVDHVLLVELNRPDNDVREGVNGQRSR